MIGANNTTFFALVACLVKVNNHILFTEQGWWRAQS